MPCVVRPTKVGVFEKRKLAFFLSSKAGEVGFFSQWVGIAKEICDVGQLNLECLMSSHYFIKRSVNLGSQFFHMASMSTSSSLASNRYKSSRVACDSWEETIQIDNVRPGQWHQVSLCKCTMAYALKYSRRLEMIVRISQVVGLWGSLTSLHPGAILVAVHGAMVACHCVRRHQRDVKMFRLGEMEWSWYISCLKAITAETCHHKQDPRSQCQALKLPVRSQHPAGNPVTGRVRGYWDHPQFLAVSDMNLFHPIQRIAVTAQMEALVDDARSSTMLGWDISGQGWGLRKGTEVVQVSGLIQ